MKKESVKRGYMLPEEIEKHFNKPNYKEGKEYEKMNILKEILINKPRLLSKKTRDNARKILVDDVIPTLKQEKLKGSGKNTFDELKSQVKFFHDVWRPEYVFLNETSAIPNGFVLKEAWKTAYPNEKPPIFYRIVPKATAIGTSLPDTITKEFFEKRIKDKKAKIFVYDEWCDSGSQVVSVGNSLLKAGYENVLFGYSDYVESLTDETLEDLHQKVLNAKSDKGKEDLEKEKNHFVDLVSRRNSPSFGGGQVLAPKFGAITAKQPGARASTGRFYWPRKYSSKRAEGQGVWTIDKGLRGIIIGNPEQVQCYKDIGRYIGETLSEENRKRGDLEKVLVTASIFSFFGGILLINLSMTGNAIANLSTNTTSWIGSVLLVVGLIAGFFWTKNRKKKPFSNKTRRDKNNFLERFRKRE